MDQCHGQTLRKGPTWVSSPRVPLPSRGMPRSASHPPSRQRSLLDPSIEPPDLLPVKRASRPNRLSNAIGQEHAGAVVKGFFESGACRLPAIRHLPKFRDAAAAIGRQGEDVGQHDLLEAEDGARLLDPSQGPLATRLGGRVAPNHQEEIGTGHLASVGHSPVAGPFWSCSWDPSRSVKVPRLRATWRTRAAARGETISNSPWAAVFRRLKPVG